MHKEMKGYIVPLLTSFNKDGSIDEGAMQTNLRYLVSVGTHGITMSGSFGEFPLLTEKERVRLFELAIETVGGQATIIAQTGSHDTATTIRLTQAAEKIGVDGILIIAPPFHGPAERDIMFHYEQCSKSTELPIMVYNNSRAGVNLKVSTILELSKLDNVVSVKQSSNDFFELLETIRLTQGRKDFHVTNGKEIWAFPGLAMGSDAVYGVSPLLLGRECVSMYDCAKNGDMVRGMQIQYRVNTIRSAMMKCDGVQAVTLRELVNIRGLGGGYSRAPYTELPQRDKDLLRRTLEDLGVRKVSPEAPAARTLEPAAV